MASYIVLERKREDGSIWRFDETPICKVLVDYLSNEESELPPVTIKFGSSPYIPYGCTGRDDCPGCAPREQKQPLPEEEMYFNFELNNNKLKMDDKATEEFLQIVEKFKLTELCDGRMPPDPISRVEINQARKTAYKTEYFVLKAEHMSMYNLLNTYKPYELIDNLY